MTKEEIIKEIIKLANEEDKAAKRARKRIGELDTGESTFRSTTYREIRIQCYYEEAACHEDTRRKLTRLLFDI